MALIGHVVGSRGFLALADAGLAPTAAADASHLVNVHVLGSVAFEVTAPPDGSDVVTTRFRWGLDRLLDGLAAYAVPAGVDRSAPR